MKPPKFLKSDWFSYDKWAHGWLHMMVVRVMRSYTEFSLLGIFVISLLVGIAYEIGDLIWHCVIKKEITFKEYLKDSLKDLCWNVIGASTGMVI